MCEGVWSIWLTSTILHLRWRRDADAGTKAYAGVCEDNDTCLLQVELEVEGSL